MSCQKPRWTPQQILSTFIFLLLTTATEKVMTKAQGETTNATKTMCFKTQSALPLLCHCRRVRREERGRESRRLSRAELAGERWSTQPSCALYALQIMLMLWSHHLLCKLSECCNTINIHAGGGTWHLSAGRLLTLNFGVNVEHMQRWQTDYAHRPMRYLYWRLSLKRHNTCLDTCRIHTGTLTASSFWSRKDKHMQTATEVCRGQTGYGSESGGFSQSGSGKIIQTQVRSIMVWSHWRKDLGLATGKMEVKCARVQPAICFSVFCQSRDTVPSGSVWLHVPPFWLCITVLPEHRLRADY